MSERIDAGAATRIATGITRDRNRRLLATLLTDGDVVEVDGGVPAGTDLCIVDEAKLSRVGGALETWRDDQRPTFAPVLLLVESGIPDPWERYADELSRRVDAIVQIPASKSAIAARLEILLEMRDVSRRLASEHQLTEQIFDTSPLAKVVLDAEGRVVRVNQRAEELFECQKSELRGRVYDAGDWTAIDEDGDPIPPSALPFRRVVETGEPVYGYEHGIERSDGEQLWLSVNMGPIRDETGAVEYVVGALEDVTVRRSQERELERQLDLFQRAQTIADVGAWEYDVDGDEWYWTGEVGRIHGRSPDANPRLEDLLENYRPEDRTRLVTAFERAVEDGEPFGLELRLTDANGEGRWVQVRGEPQRVGGEVVRIRGTLQDVTDRKERELELRQMTRAVDEAPIGVVVTDPSLEDNPMTYVNEGFTEQTGYDEAAAIDRNCRFLQGEGTDPETVAEIRRAVDAEKPVSTTIRNYRADGTSFWNELEVAPVRDDEGDVINYIGFQQDVTERVERRRQLEVLDRYLRHNLRNKMNVVQGMAKLVRERTSGAVADYAERIDDVAATLLGNVEKERRITRVLRDEPSVTDVQLMSELRAAVATLRERHPAADVSLSGPDGVVVRGTADLAMAFEELLENAVVHNDRESPVVNVTASTTGEEVVVRIADDGPGIPEMEVDVFAGSEAETAVHHGGGLGLWLVYLIVRRSGGSVAFEANGSRGSVVAVTLAAGSEA